MDDNGFELHKDLALIKKGRLDAEKIHGTELKEQIASIASQTELEKSQRQDRFSNIAQRLQDETLRVQENIDMEKRIRVAS